MYMRRLCCCFIMFGISISSGVSSVPKLCGQKGSDRHFGKWLSTVVTDKRKGISLIDFNSSKTVFDALA